MSRKTIGRLRAMPNPNDPSRPVRIEIGGAGLRMAVTMTPEEVDEFVSALSRLRSSGMRPEIPTTVPELLRLVGSPRIDRHWEAVQAVVDAARWSVQPLRNAEGKSIGGGHTDSCRCRLCRALARLDRSAPRARRAR